MAVGRGPYTLLVDGATHGRPPLVRIQRLVAARKEARRIMTQAGVTRVVILDRDEIPVRRYEHRPRGGYQTPIIDETKLVTGQE